MWLKVWEPSFKYQFTSPKILVKTKMNRQGLVLTYILGQEPIFLQEWQKSVQIDIAIYEYNKVYTQLDIKKKRLLDTKQF